jgi:hypothetical protein
MDARSPRDDEKTVEREARIPPHRRWLTGGEAEKRDGLLQPFPLAISGAAMKSR